MNLLGDVQLHKIKVAGWTHTQMNTWERIWSKLQAIWTRQSKSPYAANKIREILGKLLKRPSPTRWNSGLDSVEDITKHLKDQDKKKKLKEVIESFKETNSKKSFKFFSDSEIEMMNAYVKIFKPVAIALDTIQGEKMIYGGMLIPTIAILEGNLCKIQDDKDLKSMKPIITHVLGQIRKRFQMYLEDDDLYLATAFHPFFKLAGIRRICIEKLDHIRNRMVEILLKFVYETEPEKESTNEATSDDTNENTKKTKMNFYDQLWDMQEEDVQEVIVVYFSLIYIYIISYMLKKDNYLVYF